jgi:nucleotide-binding universal stress UspA family protein
LRKEDIMKLLVPVDGSKYSQAAIHFIASRSALIGTDAQVELLNVQAPVPVRAARVVGKDVVRSYYDDESAKALRPGLAALKKAGVQFTSATRVGNATEEIARVAEKTRPDLVVMGSHGHGAFAGLILGSVTNGVLARTTAPLLVLRGSRMAKGASADSLKVGIAVDGSKFGKAAVKYVLKQRALFGAQAQFSLIHVVPDFAGAVMPDMAGIALPALNPEELKSIQDKAFATAVEPMCKLFEKNGVAVQTVALTGNAGDEIAAYTKKHKLDVLVLGSHGYGAFKQAVLGSVATRVAAHCDTPLLLVR